MMYIYLYIELVIVIVIEQMNNFIYDIYVLLYMCIGNILYIIEVLINLVFKLWLVIIFYLIWGNCFQLFIFVMDFNGMYKVLKNIGLKCFDVFNNGLYLFIFI